MCSAGRDNPAAADAQSNAEGQTRASSVHKFAELVHDLRTPLTSIIGASTSLRDYGDRLEAGMRDQLIESIIDEAERLDRLLKSFSIIRRFHDGTLALTCTPMRLCDLVADVRRNLAPRYNDVELVLEGGLDETRVNVDTSLFALAITNALEVMLRWSVRPASVVLMARENGSRITLGPEAAIAPALMPRITELEALAEDTPDGGRQITQGSLAQFMLEAARCIFDTHQSRFEFHVRKQAERVAFVTCMERV